MTPERERFAEALAIQRLHSSGAPRWIAERIGALAAAGDVAGVERFEGCCQSNANRSPPDAPVVRGAGA